MTGQETLGLYKLSPLMLVLKAGNVEGAGNVKDREFWACIKSSHVGVIRTGNFGPE